MEAKNKFISKILPIFINAGFGIEKFDDTTYDIIDRTIIGKAKIGSIKVLENGDLSVKLGGETKKHAKFSAMMKNSSIKAKPIYNAATVGKMVRNMISDYKSAKKVIYNESYEQLAKNMIVEVTRDELEDAIDSYLEKLVENDIEPTKADLLTYVSDKLGLNEDECEAKFGEVLDLTLDYEEDKYINAMDRIFEESEIKSDFRKFLQENTITDLALEIKEDRTLRRLRDTEAYKNLDEEGKYRKLQKYVLNTHGSRFSNTEDLDEICHQIAAEDEDSF